MKRHTWQWLYPNKIRILTIYSYIHDILKVIRHVYALRGSETYLQLWMVVEEIAVSFLWSCISVCECSGCVYELVVSRVSGRCCFVESPGLQSCESLFFTCRQSVCGIGVWFVYYVLDVVSLCVYGSVWILLLLFSSRILVLQPFIKLIH